MADNLSIQAQLNALIQEQNKFLETQTRMMKDQASLSKELVTNFSKLNFKSATSDIEGMNEAVGKSRDTLSEFGTQSGTASALVKEGAEKAAMAFLNLEGKAEDLIKKYGKLALVGGGVFHGLMGGMKFSINLFRNVTSGAWGLIESLTQIGASILAIPFKMLSGLISMASTGGSNELQQALEDIRKEFGALHATAGAAIIGMARSMKGGLAETGLSTWRIFGNLAERLKTIAEYAKNLGPLFEALAPSIRKNTERFAAYNKGLGLTEEGMRAVAARAFATGTDITEVQRDMANYSLQLGRAFGLSAKMISRDVGTMMADFKHFGGMSVQQLTQVSVYARRLGVDVKSIVGIIERYDNFEDAAKGAAHLSQAFGLNVDALQLMKAQNPAERIEMIRKAFFTAGRSVENMTRQERNLLAQQTGLGEDTLDLVFSLKNASTSYSDIQKKSEAAKRKQISQAEAMKRLADSIERLVKSGSAMQGGFLDRFIQGFMRGVTWSRDFRGIMINLRRTLFDVYRAGIQVGRAFVQMFPGVRDIFKSIRELFNPRKFRELMKKVVDSFKDFFRDLTTNPQTALPRLFNRLKKGFFDFFQSNSANGRRLINGFRQFFVALSTIAGGLLKLAIQGVTTGIRFIVDLLTGRRKLGLGGAGRQATSFIGQLLGPIVDALTEAGPALWQAVKDLFSALWARIRPYAMRALPYALGILFGPAVISGALKGLTAALIPVFLKSIGGLFTGRALSQGADVLRAGLGRMTGAASAVPAAAGGTKGVSQAAEVASQTKEAANAVQQQSGFNWRRLATIAAMMVIFLIALGGMMYEVYQFAKAIERNKISTTSIVAAGVLAVASATAMAAMAGALGLLQLATRGLNAGGVVRMAAGILIIAGIVELMSWQGRRIIDAFKNTNLGALARATTAMPVIVRFYLAAGAITAIAGLIGSFGLMGAVAISIGLVTLVAVIEVMVNHGMRLMRLINSFSPSPGFIEKTKAFALIMTAVGNFAGNVARVVEATRPSFFSFLRRGNQEAKQRKTLQAVNTVIGAMTNGIQNILSTISRTFSGIQGGEAGLQKAQIIGGLLTGVGELAKALSTGQESLNRERSWLDRLVGSTEQDRSLVVDLGSYVMIMGNELNRIITRVTHIVNLFSGTGINENQKRAAEVVVSLLGTLGTLARAFVPNPALIQELNKGRDFTGQLRSYGDFLDRVFSLVVNSDIVQRLSTIITSFATSLTSRAFTPAQMQVLRLGMPLFSDALKATTSIANALTNLSQDRATGGGNVYQATQFVTALLSGISEQLPALITRLVTSFGNARITPGAVRNVIAVMSSLRSIVEAITAINTIEIPSPGDIQTRFFTLGMSIDAVRSKLHDLNLQLGGTSGASASIASETQILLSRIQKGGIAHTAHAIQDMVRQVNQLSSALAGIRPINIQTRLADLGRNLGVGAEGTYHIENRTFQINVNFSVKVDNEGLDAFELATIRRPGGTRFGHTETRH